MPLCKFIDVLKIFTQENAFDLDNVGGVSYHSRRRSGENI